MGASSKTDILLRDRALRENEVKLLERDEKIAQLATEAQKTAKEAVKTAENAKIQNKRIQQM